MGGVPPPSHRGVNSQFQKKIEVKKWHGGQAGLKQHYLALTFISLTIMASELIGMEQLLESVAALGAEELLQLIDAASTRLKKVGLPKGKRVSKGDVPTQLQKNYEWVSYVLGDARLNGWEAFTIKKTQTDKATGLKTEVEYDMAGSAECEDGTFVYSDTNEVFTHGHAMSYSKMLKDRNDPLYQQFLEAFTEQVGEVAMPKKKEVKKISAAEAAAEKKRKDEEKAMEKAAEKAQKEAEKARVKAEKDAEKEAEKAAKDAAKAAKAKPVVQKAPLVTPVKRLPSPSPASEASAAALPAAALPVASLPVASPVVTIAKKVPGAPVKVKGVDTWKCAENEVDVWVWKGETYLRDWRNYVWRQEDGEMGDFMGMYIFAKDVIEEAEEPVDV